MEKIDINQNVGELFCEEPFALRIRKVCGSHEIVSVRDLCLHTNQDLIRFRHLGHKSIAHIGDILSRHGLRPGMTEKELDIYMGIKSEEDEGVTTIIRYEESEAAKWQQRRYEVARHLYVKYRSLSPYEAMEEAEKLILALQGVPETHNRSKRKFLFFNR